MEEKTRILSLLCQAAKVSSSFRLTRARKERKRILKSFPLRPLPALSEAGGTIQIFFVFGQE